MLLNSRMQTRLNGENSLPIVMIHGLFGSLDNLGGLARELHSQHDVLQVDLRNHGLSSHQPTMSYQEMAQDVLETLDAHNIDNVIVIGHSMGGKVAMALSALIPERVKKLIIIDIAPVAYSERRHDSIFAAIRAVNEAGVKERSAATAIMKQFLQPISLIQFLLKAFDRGEWRFNVDALWANYDVISNWQPLPPRIAPTLFIRGADSPYLDRRYREDLVAQFPNAKAHVIHGAGHWVHGEKPREVLRSVQRFLAES